MNRAVSIVGVVIIVMGTVVPTLGLVSFRTYSSQPAVTGSDILNVSVPYYLVQHYNYTRTIAAYRYYTALATSLDTNSTIIDYSTTPPTTVTSAMFASGWILGAGGSYCQSCIDYTKPAIYAIGAVILAVGFLMPKKMTEEEMKQGKLPYWGSSNR